MMLTPFISTFFIYNFGIFWCNFRFLVKTINLVLWGENLSPEFFDHISSSFRLVFSFLCSSISRVSFIGGSISLLVLAFLLQVGVYGLCR